MYSCICTIFLKLLWHFSAFSWIFLLAYFFHKYFRICTIISEAFCLYLIIKTLLFILWISYFSRVSLFFLACFSTFQNLVTKTLISHSCVFKNDFILSFWSCDLAAKNLCNSLLYLEFKLSNLSHKNLQSSSASSHTVYLLSRQRNLFAILKQFVIS